MDSQGLRGGRRGGMRVTPLSAVPTIVNVHGGTVPVTIALAILSSRARSVCWSRRQRHPVTFSDIAGPIHSVLPAPNAAVCRISVSTQTRLALQLLNVPCALALQLSPVTFFSSLGASAASP